MKGTGRIQRFTSHLPGLARACPDLPEFARICPEAIYGFGTVETDVKRKITTFSVPLNGFQSFRRTFRDDLVVQLWTEKGSTNQIAGSFEVEYLENGSTVRDDFLHGDKGP